ncbi:MAG: ATP-binding protein [Pseudomonadota bacterium]
MKRYLESYILQDLNQKIVLLSGPRQAGKTTIAKQLYQSYDYLNYDLSEHRVVLQEKSWDRHKKLIIFDEIHKMKKWKQWLKGVFDVEGIPPELMVTGSAKLNVYRKVGDSLAGRYFQYRLHPLDLKELCHKKNHPPEELFAQLWQCSGFPEPFLKGSKTFYRRWRRTHIDIILRQDLLDIQTVKDINSIETLVQLLKNRIGSCISYANLARDLEYDAKTIKRWLELLENLYLIFKVKPYNKNIARSLLKEPKYYFYDHAYAENDDGARLENMVAASLLKELDYIEDTTGKSTALRYLRSKDGRGLDFITLIDEQPRHIIEVKKSDDKPSKHFAYFAKYLPEIKKIQLVKELKREKTFADGIEVRSLVHWLAHLDLQQA